MVFYKAQLSNLELWYFSQLIFLGVKTQVFDFQFLTQPNISFSRFPNFWHKKGYFWFTLIGPMSSTKRKLQHLTNFLLNMKIFWLQSTKVLCFMHCDWKIMISYRKYRIKLVPLPLLIRSIFILARRQSQLFNLAAAATQEVRVSNSKSL